ncbi:MAG: FG-GAP-like repeat-containing protein [Chthoniobacteraceae bacterium]
MTLTALSRCAAALFCSLFATTAIAGQAQYSHGDPTPLEQQMLELINRSRMNPTQEGIILDTVNTAYSVAARAQAPAFFTNIRGEFASYPSVAPLAFHPLLIQEAREHSQDMVANQYFAHTNLAGQDPTARAAAIGYNSGVGENLDGAGATSPDDIIQGHFDFMVDYNNIDLAHPLGHRLNVLNSSYSEVGVGIAGPRNGGMITQEFGGPARSYILGVAYSDANANGAYDVGEGFAGITVTPDSGNWLAVTSTSGGFAIPVDPVQTVSDTLNVPFPVQGNTWDAVQPYIAAYRQQQMAAAPTMTMNLTWSGSGIASPITTSVTMKRPVLRNYKVMGTDGWYYSMSMVTAQNAKADLSTARVATPPIASIPNDVNNDGKADFIFQNGSGQIYTWLLDGTGSPLNFATGDGLKPGSKFLYGGGLADWKIVGRADVNNDGVPDLIFQNNVGQIYAWCLDGTGNPVNFATGSGLKPGSKLLYGGGLGDWRITAVTDVNGDGFADLVFQNSVGQVYVWFLDGSGNTVNFATGSGLKPGSKLLYGGGLGDWRITAVADVNGDGFADLVFQNSIGQVYVWFLDGSGNAVNLTTGSGLKPGAKFLYGSGLGDWRVTAVADVNGDSKADLVFQNSAGQIYVWFLDGTGNGIDFTRGSGLKPGSQFLYGGGLGDWKLR